MFVYSNFGLNSTFGGKLTVHVQIFIDNVVSL